MFKNRILLVGAAAAFVLAGCAGAPEPAVHATQEPISEPTTEIAEHATQDPDNFIEPVVEVETTEPVEIETTEEPVETTEPETEGEFGESYGTAIILLGASWANTGAEDQENICWGYNALGSDWAYDIVTDGMEFSLNREAFNDFFDDVC